MSSQALSQTCTCSCGASRFVATPKPLVRFLCHCTICQSVFRQPYADITALRAEDVTLAKDHTIQFKKYRQPPAVSRGTCSSCGAPVVGFLSLVPFVPLAMVSSKNFTDQSVLPEPSIHIFYHRRVADIADDLPKYSGYWRSEWGVTARVLSALLHGRA